MSTGVTDAKPKSKDERIKDFVKSIEALEQAIQPYKDQRTDLRKNYIANQWLTKAEMKNLLKCYNLIKHEDNFDFDALAEMYKKLKP